MQNAPSRVAWSIADWGAAVGLSRATVNRLLADGRLNSVKLGSRRLITVDPAAFLASAAEGGR